ncbi:MAG: IS1 family transposase [Candidatus Methanomethylophilaceae archaeon]|nr:IS1 family transposase [Candidatus Methanomethylophilaceae archaeon]
MGERGPKSQFTNISCTNPKCRLYGRTGEGNIVGNGTYEACGQISQKYICRECGHYFNSRTETAYDGLRTNADKFDLAIKCLNEGMGVRATARTVGCSVSTVQRWTVRASVQAAAVSSSFENNLDPSGMQFDEMSGTLKKN